MVSRNTSRVHVIFFIFQNKNSQYQPQCAWTWRASSPPLFLIPSSLSPPRPLFLVPSFSSPPPRPLLFLLVSPLLVIQPGFLLLGTEYLPACKIDFFKCAHRWPPTPTTSPPAAPTKLALLLLPHSSSRVLVAM